LKEIHSSHQISWKSLAAITKKSFGPVRTFIGWTGHLQMCMGVTVSPSWGFLPPRNKGMEDIEPKMDEQIDDGTDNMAG
jgi:hypothetical protein